MNELIEHLSDARTRLFELALDLDDSQWMGPRLATVNPIRWEIGHVAWFQEHWLLRHLHRRPSLRADSDSLYDSMRVPHDTRWDLPLPGRAETLAYAAAVLEGTRALFEQREPTARERYFLSLITLHEDMHAEAFAYTRQTLAYRRPTFANTARPALDAGPCRGDVAVPGGVYRLGADSTQDFFFDNEKWAHDVCVEPFRIARAPVTNDEFAEFVDSRGYREQSYWSHDGWRWRTVARAERPTYWTPANGGGWNQRRYDVIEPLRPRAPVMFVNAFEAEAYCAWAGRRLPTEPEWELAASGFEKRRFPWGGGIL